MAEKQQKTKFKKFFEENKTLVITIPLFIILVIVVILVNVFGGSGNKNTADNTPQPTQQAEQQTEVTALPETNDNQNSATETEGTTLPQNERDKDTNEIIRNPFADPYEVSGIIYDKSGNSIAIIEAENKSFIVQAGEEIGSYFKVIKIEETQVFLEVEGKELILSIASD